MTRTLCLLTLSIFLFFQISFAQTVYQPKAPQLSTRWTKLVSPQNALTAYPRPQMVRKQWTNLNGLWQYAITDSVSGVPVRYDGKILVPYPVESALSGVKQPVQPTQALWYQRTFPRPSTNSDEKVLLHFGAVDWDATVFVNGQIIGHHTGGYDNFSIDITSALHAGENELVLKVTDPSDKGPNPHGKQVLQPESIWYTPTTGIWQTVWMETVPEAYITDVRITPDVDHKRLQVVAQATEGYEVFVTVLDSRKQVATAKGMTNTTIDIPLASPKLWSPGQPFLYDLVIRLKKNNATIDEVSSYAGMRKIAVNNDAKGFARIYLNNERVFNLGVLDQGFWPDGIYTAPTDEALKFDIEAIKAMGFNTIRKHIKREPDRWYYWCDQLGMLVWQDMINPSFDLTDTAKRIFEFESKEHITELYNHPSIVVYTLFNEKWGQYDQERLTRWIKGLDTTRVVNGHSGELLWVNEKLRSASPNAWIASDLADVHSYPDPMNVPYKGTPAAANGGASKEQVAVLGEFGGIGTFIADHQWNTGSAWGYITVTPAALKAKYQVMNEHLALLQKEGLAASIYTQPFDVEGEQNGLMTYDREVVKIPFEEMRKIHRLILPTLPNMPMVVAQNADLTDPLERYAALLQQYIGGKRDLATVKQLSMLSAQTNDAAGRTRFTNEYVRKMKPPYSDEDWSFIETSTRKVTDNGFRLLLKRVQDHADSVSFSATARRALHVKLMNLIYQDVIARYVPTPDAKPDWEEIEKSVIGFGTPGEEILLRAKTIHTFNQQDWAAYKPAAKRYLEKYGSNVKEEELNMFRKAIDDN